MTEKDMGKTRKGVVYVNAGNEVLTCIRERRSARRYTNEQISPEQLDALLDAAIWAPSGGNNQSWLFTVIQKKDILLKLNEIVIEAFQHWIPDDDYPGKLGMKEHSRRDGYNFYYNAPTLIIASNRPNYENAMADCSLALENIFLAARSLGLGSCYINQLHWLRGDPVVREYLFEFGIPKEHTICSSAAIGFAAAESTAPARKDGAIRIIR
ncbi:MAG: nitroreductase family protein [Clostridiales bacterium]|jgi:nitroreductase|nr:nitroreductase family protein [Clostridiales bacterium]